ncbi:MAG: hypothetical protein M3N45_12415 [Actinomycetota bacterium]|nr:hypothetical protein [Actinomycetota bacterium]
MNAKAICEAGYCITFHELPKRCRIGWVKPLVGVEIENPHSILAGQSI